MSLPAVTAGLQAAWEMATLLSARRVYCESVWYLVPRPLFRTSLCGRWREAVHTRGTGTDSWI